MKCSLRILSSIIFFLLSLVCTSVFAQCGTECQRGNTDGVSLRSKVEIGMQLFEDNQDSLHFSLPQSYKSNSNTILVGGFEPGYQIPIKFHLLVDDNGNLATNPIGNDVENRTNVLLAQLNGLMRFGYRGTNQNVLIPTTVDCGMQFYKKGMVNVISNSQVNNGNQDEDIELYKAMAGAAGNFDYGAINVYLVSTITSNDANFPIIEGFATLPTGGMSLNAAFRVYLRTQGIGQIRDINFALLFMHEIGHSLGLSHTFDGYRSNDNNSEVLCEQEPADETRLHCNAGAIHPLLPKDANIYFGDGLPDTRADIRRHWDNSDLDAGGLYVAVPIGDRLRDKYGDVWEPPVYNIMSYAHNDYRRIFSPMQIGLINNLVGYNGSVTGFSIHNQNPFVDVYEPDNLADGDIPFDYFTQRLGQSNIVDIHGNHYKDHRMFPGRQYIRGIHRTINGSFGSPNTYGYGDNDIFIIRSYAKQVYKIKTHALYTNGPDVLIELIDPADGSVITSVNSGITNEELYVELDGSPVVPQNHFIRIKSVGTSIGVYVTEYEVAKDCAAISVNHQSSIIPLSEEFSLAFSYEEFVNEVETNNIIPANEFGSFEKVYANHDFFVNGTFSFGSSDYVGFVDLNVAPDIQSNPHVPVDVNFCNSVVEVGTDGLLEVGAKPSAANSVIRIGNGSTLKLQGSAEIRLRNSSNLIIEEGGELDLVGSNVKFDLCATCAVEIHGKLKLGPNSNLTHNTDGYIVFDQNIPIVNGSYDLGSFYDYDPSSNIEIIGNMNNGIIPKIVVKRPFYLKGQSNQTPNSFTMKEASIFLDGSTFIYSFCQTNIDNCSFDGFTQIPNGHLGLRIYGNPGLNVIRNSEFRNGDVGIHAQWLGNHPALRVLDNTFSTTEGLKLESGKFEVSRNVFNGGSRVSTNGIQGASIFNYNDFYGGQIELNGSNNTYAFLTGNKFYNAIGPAVTANQIVLDLQCNEFRNGDVGISIDAAASVVADENASNYFYNNTIGINLTNPNQGPNVSLFLKDGNNEFVLGPNQTNKLHVNGFFDFVDNVPNSLFTSTYANSGGLDVDNNYFELSTVTCLPGMPCPPAGYYSVMPVSIKVYENRGMPNQNLRADVPLYVPNNAANINAICDNGIIGGAEFPVLNYIQGIYSPSMGGVVNTYGKNLKTLLISQAQNISFGNFVAADLQTLDTLQTILESGITGSDVSTLELLDITYELMLTALENCYTLGHLSYSPLNITGTPHAELSRSIALIDSQLVELSPADSSEMPLVFKYNLDKAMSYRNGAFYSHALVQLLTRSNWSFNDTEVKRADYWECIIRAEHDVLSGTIDEEEYTLVRSGCEATYAGFAYKDNSFTELNPGYLYEVNVKQDGKFNVYPNPAVNLFSIDISFSYEEITLSSQSGVVVREYDYSPGNSYPLEGLAPGVYTVTIKEGNGAENHSMLLVE